MESRVLTINGGSSSLKFAVFAPGDPAVRLTTGAIERIGLPDPALRLVDAPSGRSDRRGIDAPDHASCVPIIADAVAATAGGGRIAAIGHRIVHGGPRHHSPQAVTPELVAELRRIAPLDPEHLPAELSLIEAFAARYAGVPQVACFDTAFHHGMPRVATLLPIPRRYEARGVRRYGFHGLSYAYLMKELARRLGPRAAEGRVILAHLGNGASLAAVRAGAPVDTTMAFTPTAGLVMSRRSGDLDPGLVAYLGRTDGMTSEQFHRMVNTESGLLGVSEISPDVRDLLAREAQDTRAAEALALFCYQARKWIGAFAAALAGLDTLVFSAGIGENSPVIRARICDGLAFLGVTLDERRNQANEILISAPGRPVAVCVIPTDEEAEIVAAVSDVTGLTRRK
jgi:acetate kinase